MAGTAAAGTRRRVTPYLLSLPALAYLAVFFVVPLWALFRTSLSTAEGSVFDPTLEFSWAFSNYQEAFETYDAQIYRSFWYALAATLLALVLAYPLSYVIAFKAGKWKNVLLGLVILPFFITFIVRTLAWKTIFGDNTIVTELLDVVGLTTDGRILSTQWAVIGGLTYNFLPFMILPIYVSIEKIDPRLLEAARDLYAGGWRTFRKVLLPLSLPGVFAGSLLTFIPAAGDFVNAQYLGGTNNSMVGTVIQSQFLVVKDYPLAAALSAVLMLIILAMVLVYTKVLGTEDLV
ncbi:MAG TPA: ABC transporter permease [Acidimicrobiia bacterium]|nr:ABC transporter permease [Acidimicrobiia bacterium]